MPIPFCGCWMWLRSIGSHGYGNAKVPGANGTVAHRVSYRAFKGPIPKGMLVQHSCDQKWCVNPDHLSLGTDATNAVDKQIKGRAAKKLRPADVHQIRELLDTGMPMLRIARRFGVDPALIPRIRDGHVWRHLPEHFRTLISEEIDEVNRQLKAVS
ncbi:MAG: HNH endonuclease [Actinobacteria bacterium]|nr:HNH endonuclease [Actinomycetota bacterium]